MVLETTLVAMAELVSKTMLAPLVITVPTASPGLGLIEKLTWPLPRPLPSSGGRKPARGSAGAAPVALSMALSRQSTRPLEGLSDTLTSTRKAPSVVPVMTGGAG
jgi:hypothetical protein